MLSNEGVAFGVEVHTVVVNESCVTCFADHAVDIDDCDSQRACDLVTCVHILSNQIRIQSVLGVVDGILGEVDDTTVSVERAQ